MRRDTNQPDTNGHLLERILSVENVRKAWEWVAAYFRNTHWCRTRVRNLLALGTFKRQAIMTSLSRKGPWHLARRLATQSGMTNKLLADQGLVIVKDLWVKIHYPATAR